MNQLQSCQLATCMCSSSATKRLFLPGAAAGAATTRFESSAGHCKALKPGTVDGLSRKVRLLTRALRTSHARYGCWSHHRGVRLLGRALTHVREAQLDEPRSSGMQRAMRPRLQIERLEVRTLPRTLTCPVQLLELPRRGSTP